MHRFLVSAAHKSSGKTTISIGLATFPEDAGNKEQLIYTADMALLAAKRSGKNQTKVAGGY